MKIYSLLSVSLISIFGLPNSGIFAAPDLEMSETAPGAVEAPSSSIAIERLVEPWKEKLEQTRKPSVLIELKPGKDELLASKVGGAPFVPAGATIPVGESGKPLFLLAQINFAEVPALPGYPTSGIVQFFIAADDFYGANFKDKLDETSLSQQRNFRVVFHRSVPDKSDAASARLMSGPSVVPNPSDSLPFDPTVSLRMSFRKSSELINSHDFGLEPLLGMTFYEWSEKLATDNGLDEDVVLDSLADYLGPNDFQHKLGGYPSFTQEDPRASGSRNVLLLQLSSEQVDGKQLMWGDLGVAAFFINPEDLEKGDFSKVVYSWDCS